MNRPSPKPTKPGGLKETPQTKQRLFPYICTLPGGKTVEIKALSKLDAGPQCFAKYKEWPLVVEKKPFTRSEHLTHRVGNHEGLRELQRELEKNSKGGKKS